jgi:hypothetical protein
MKIQKYEKKKNVYKVGSMLVSGRNFFGVNWKSFNSFKNNWALYDARHNISVLGKTLILRL